MALKTTPWDSAEYLRTEEARAAYLAACMEDAPDDAAFFAHALGVVARSRNMSQLSRDTGMSREGLHKALSEDGNPSFDTVLKVMRALGYRLTVVPEKKAGSQRAAAKRVTARASKKTAAPTRRRA
jgi:probable addiction module antidote protein